ncbi:ATP-binding protein [Streptomyces sp. OfavH-34-F]|uniref:ATP-binding protein n=1 Tax=Streptomyces sp. OfavH-34-F TaxID=2917760 RepID=UPI001EF30CCD|nr:ATP-binding protein [Streptomyces sp. OfavH-34-F]MCG7526639.1 ATP-binding protein [Streptomyces sp. OfavH-34-F]
MTSNIGTPSRTTQPPSPPLHLGTPSFAMQFTATPRGARLARRLSAVRLDAWGIPYGTRAHEAVVLITAELTANAVRHGYVSGRDFHLLLRLVERPGTAARVEVTDTRGEKVPPRPGKLIPAGLMEDGRGLLVVEALATRWGWYPRSKAPGKTVWAEYELTGGGAD